MQILSLFTADAMQVICQIECVQKPAIKHILVFFLFPFLTICLSPSSKATLNKFTEDSSVVFKRNCQNRSLDLIISISFLDPSPQMYPMYWVHLHLMHPTNQPTHPICAELKQMILIFLVILDQDFFCLLLKFLTNFVDKNKYLFSCFHPTIALKMRN